MRQLPKISGTMLATEPTPANDNYKQTFNNKNSFEIERITFVKDYSETKVPLGRLALLMGYLAALAIIAVRLAI